jgi:hypothetical protein
LPPTCTYFPFDSPQSLQRHKPDAWHTNCPVTFVIRKLKSGKYRLYSRKLDSRTHKRRNLGTFDTRAAAEKHERAVQFFKRHG